MFSIEENLFDFAFCPMPAFAYLSELAAPEDWVKTIVCSRTI